jgi:hypothetical protein
MKFTQIRSSIDNRVMSYNSDLTVAGKKIIISRTGTPILGITWTVNHPLAGGHKFDGGRSRHSTLVQAKAHAVKMLLELGA